MFEVDVKFDGLDKILANHGLQEAGPAQQFFTSEMMRLSDPYVPFRTGILKNRVYAINWESIVYDTPYARYHWFGKLMVDPITKKGAFYDPRSGRFWSRPNTPKELTDRDLQYTGGPLRGPRWVERCWIDNKDSILKSVEAFIMGGSK